MHAIAEQALTAMSGQTCGLLNGEPFGSGKDTLPLNDPDTNQQIGTLIENSPTDVGKAVEAASRCFDEGMWRAKPLGERSEILRRTAELIRKEADMLAALDSLTTGLLWHRSTRRHAHSAADWFEYFADLAISEQPATFTTDDDIETVVSREAIGVVALYTPWNIPLMAAGLKLAAALIMGNSVVIKPSELSPLATRRLVQLLHEAGVPRGAVQLVNGRGEVTGAALAQHALVGAISFTGGPNAGAVIAGTAAQRFAKVTMELGGKSANIVLNDAPYDAALSGTVAAAFGNSGQACLAGSRILVETEIADQFIADLVDKVRALKIGHTFDDDAEIGPQSSTAQMNRVLEYVDVARGEGAKILCGGQRPPGFVGCQVEPTIALVHSNDLRVTQEEIFGPLVTVQVVANQEEAIAVANDTNLGLAGYVWSEDLQRAQNVADQLRTGTVLVNTAMVREKAAPFGGMGASGVDREGGRWSLDFYSEAKTRVTRSHVQQSNSEVRAT